MALRFPFVRGDGVDASTHEAQVRWYAVAAIQGELLRRHYSLAHDGIFGPGTEAAVRQFQSYHHLPVTGQVEGTTAKAMFVDPCHIAAVHAGISLPTLFAGLIALESAFSPGATGANNLDSGLAQINLSTEGVSERNAFDPAYALPWAAARLQSAFTRFSGKGADLAWNCAICNHNSPVYAKQWYDAGTPPNDTASKYVALVKQRAQ